MKTQNISKMVGDRTLFNDLSLTIPAGGIIGIIGPNGTGKTTLLNILAGLDQPDQGEVRIGESVIS